MTMVKFVGTLNGKPASGIISSEYLRLLKPLPDACRFIGLRTNKECQIPPTWLMAQGLGGKKKHKTPICGTHRREMLNIGIPQSDFIPFHKTQDKKAT